MYTPIIVRDDEIPYLYCNLSNLPEVEQERIKDELTRMVELYQSSHQRTEDWLKKASDVNKQWRKSHEDLGCLLNSGIVLK